MLKACTWWVASVSFCLIFTGCSEREQYEGHQATMVDTTGAEYLTHEVIVRQNSQITPAQFSQALSALGATVVDDRSAIAQRLSYARLRLPTSITADEAISFLQTEGVTESAERNYVISINATSSDPRLSELWGLNTIQAPQAWEHTQGSSQIIVAVSDTGIDHQHPDLEENMWTNPNEIPNNGIDDDGNGYIDDIYGWNWVDNEADPADDHGHGTHCAGTIGAVGNNEIGVVGVNWHVKLQALKFMYPTSSGGASGTLWDAAQSILYAAENGANILNASWGCMGCNAWYIRDAISTFETSGGIFVAAAGNDALNNDIYPHYPSSHDHSNIIAVAATDNNDDLSWFSNYGPNSVDIAAPGVSILSTVPGGGYASWNGTSMAAPHVAGLAALYLSIHPDTPSQDLINKIYESADDISAADGQLVHAKRINAYTLIYDSLVAPPSPTGLIAEAGAQDDITVSWDEAPETEPGESPIASFRLHWGTSSGNYTNTLDFQATQTTTRLTNLASATQYFFTLTTLTENGSQSPPSEEASAITQDATPPPQVLDLQASSLQGELANGWVSQASGEFSDYWSASHVYDGDPNTGWSTPPRPEAQEEYITVQLSGQSLVDQITFYPTPAYPEFFPIDLDVEISVDGNQWQPVGGLREITTDIFTSHTIRFSPVSATYIRTRVLTTYQHPSGNYYCGIGEIEIREVSESPTTIVLGFTAPGDDPGSGFSETYDLRYLTSPITEANFDTATPITTGTPKAAGVLESVQISDLLPETDYYFALVAQDSSGNISPLSNVAQATTLIVPPNPIIDLSVDSVEANSVTLQWTATGDNGNSGQAATYDLRISENPITAGNFFGATNLPLTIVPAASGANETYTISQLTDGALYYFALKVTDTAGATSSISNIISAQPQSGTDTIPPAAVDDLHGFEAWRTSIAPVTVVEASTGLGGFGGANALVDANASSDWYIPSDSADSSHFAVLDLGVAKTISRFKLHPSAQVGQGGSVPAHIAIDISADRISWNTSLEIDDLAPEAMPLEYAIEAVQARYVRLRVLGHNSAQPDSPVDGCCWYSYISELDVLTLPEQFDADLTWVAPGDDQWLGTASSYDLRHSTSVITEENFANATALPSNAPSPAGLIELQRISDLALETTHYFALRAIDDAGNVSGLSNTAQITTPVIAPATIDDLQATNPSQTTMDLQFTATGDDGTQGRANAYIVKYSTSPLSAATWDLAQTAVHSTFPQEPGTSQTIVVNGLTDSTVYYFGIKVVDDVGAESLISNIAVAETHDGIAPSPISNLTATIHNPTLAPPLAASVTSDSGSYDSGSLAANLVDGDPNSIWLSQSRQVATDEFIEIELSESKRLGKIRVAPALSYLDLFPKSFELYLRNSQQDPWTLVINETQFSTQANWEEWAIGSVLAKYIKIQITQTNAWAGSYFASIAEVEIYEDPTDYTRIELGWAAPGDDDLAGKATAYDIRTNSTPINENNFSSSTPLENPPLPQVAGSFERYVATGLQPETTYCFSVKTEDDSNNISSASNSPCATTPGIPPGTIANLSVTSITGTTATLEWTATGEDGATGSASAYELKYSTQRITNDNWDTAQSANLTLTPAPAGSTETATIHGLSGLTKYYFVLRAQDSGSNWSALSNNAIATTADNIPPAVTTDLVATTNEQITGSVFLAWTAPGDNGNTGVPASYSIRASLAPITDANFEQGILITAPTPQIAGSLEQLTIVDLLPEASYFFALKTTDSSGNISTLSNNAAARTRDEAPSQITDLRIAQENPPALTLEWTAPGDDGSIGTATSYDLRIAFSPITEENFESHSQITPTPTPSPSGTTQQVTIPDLLSETQYYIAIRAIDDRNNAGPISNILNTVTADIEPPSSIDDLVASTGPSLGSLILTWTSPGDDGDTGRATAYDIRYSLTEITPENFDSATALTTLPTPTYGGYTSYFTSTSFPSEQLVYVAMRTRDEAFNWSEISNVASSTTPDIAPGKIMNLATTQAGLTSVSIEFSTTGDDNYTGIATEYDLRISTEPLTSSNFDSAQRISTDAPLQAGTTQSIAIDNLQENTSYFVAIKAIDERGNTSPISDQLSVATTDNEDPGQITDLSAATAELPGQVSLMWTATGDNGAIGQAFAYEIKYSTTPIDLTSWDQATAISQSMVPSASGESEMYTAILLPGEEALYFGIVVIDDQGNRSMVSNIASAAPPPIPPTRISNLAATATGTAIELTWSATGDDLLSGTAQSYEMRYSATVLTPENFASGTLVSGLPQPVESGGVQTVNVTGLAESTQYYFGLIAIDDLGAESTLSNITSATTDDLTPPGIPSNLVASPPNVTDSIVPISSITASSSLGSNWQPENAIDDSSTTAWSSQGTSSQQTHSLVLALQWPASIDRIRLSPDALYSSLFPVDFNIEISANGFTWHTVVIEEELSAGDGTSITWGFPAQVAQQVRINITETNTSFGLHYGVIADIEVVQARMLTGETQLTWFAPGDDGSIGRAARYEIFQHTQSFDQSTLENAQLISTGPTVYDAGSLQTWTQSELEGEATYYWAVRAIDDADNVGELSQVVSGLTNPVAPSTVADLSATADGMNEVSLSFTSPGDDHTTGTATRYEIRYADFPLTSQTYPLATPVQSPPLPQSSGNLETLVVSNLSPGTLYRFALIAYDEADTPSYLSNIAMATTDEAPDYTAPSAITTLNAQIPTAGGEVQAGAASYWSSENSSFEASNIIDANPNSMWSVWDTDEYAPATIQVGLTQTQAIDTIKLWAGAGFEYLFPVDFSVFISPDGLQWNEVASFTGITMAPNTPLTIEFASATTAYVELRATRRASSPDSPYYYVAIAELEMLSAKPPSDATLLSWHAPGDDDTEGQASSYELRYGGCPYDHPSATPISTFAPDPAGSPQRLVFSGLSPGEYCFGMTASDESGNTSALSNIAQIVVE